MAKYRLPDGRQQQKRIGPAWTKRSAPPEGYFTKTSAKAWLDDLLAQARQETLPGLVKTGKKFRDVSADWLAYCENVRDCKPSTMRDYRNMVRVLDRDFGDRKIESITSEEIELWVTNRKGSNRMLHKLRGRARERRSGCGGTADRWWRVFRGHIWTTGTDWTSERDLGTLDFVVASGRF